MCLTSEDMTYVWMCLTSEDMTHLECMCRFYLGECVRPRTKAVAVTVSCGVCIFKTMEKVFLPFSGALRVEPVIR